MNIVLTGFMGTGKTSVSKKLLKLLNLSSQKFDIIDTDDTIEKREKLKISDIFERYGEKYFRNLEKSLVQELSKKDNLIISTGGGIVLDRTNIENFRKNSLVICLKANIDVIFERVRYNKARPLLNCENPLEIIKELLSIRDSFYKNCDIMLDTSYKNIDEVAELIREYYYSSVHVSLLDKSKNYKIFINPYKENNKNLSDISYFLTRFHENKILIISDTNVSKIYLDNFTLNLKKAKFDVLSYIIPAGESNKNLTEIKNIWEKCAENFLDRQSLIISFGGGVVSDIAGFVASTYMRGIKVIHFPTSLLAMVDASIGGKTGFDLDCGKNLIGTFYQPDFIYINPDFLKTLDDRQFFSGISEVIKYALIYNYSFYFKGEKISFYNFLENNFSDYKNKEVLYNLISVSAKIKTLIVSCDEKEKGLRKILNFGHTLGHSLETFFNYEYLHGEMVAFGMMFGTFLSYDLGFLEEECKTKILKFLNKVFSSEIFKNSFNILRDEKNLEKIIDILKHDKKGSDEKYISFVLLKNIGEAFYKNLDIDVIKEELKKFISIK